MKEAMPEFNFSKKMYPPKPEPKPRKTEEDKEFEKQKLFGIIYKNMNESGIHIKTFTNEESFNKELTQFDTILEECKNITIKKLQEKVQRWRNLKKFNPKD